MNHLFLCAYAKTQNGMKQIFFDVKRNKNKIKTFLG